VLRPRAPRGIQTSSACGCGGGGTTNVVNYYDNTVYLAGRGGRFVRDGGVFAVAGPALRSATTSWHASIPTGSGRAVAVWRNYQPLWSYDTSSNNNDL